MEKTYEKQDRAFRFAFTAETGLRDGGEALRAEISAAGNMDCLIHGGNVLTGGNPKYLTMRILEEEYGAYRDCAGKGLLLPVQGEMDGWRSERYLGQIVWGIMTDEMWQEATSFVDAYPDGSRPHGKPYYYVDFPEKRVRVIVLCSHFYEIDEELEMYEKYDGFDMAQRRWFAGEALNAPEGYTALIVSHTIPNSPFEKGSFRKGLLSMLSLMNQAKKAGLNIACWLTGAYGENRVEEMQIGMMTCVKMVSRDMRGGAAFDLCELDPDARMLTVRRGAESETIGW